MFKYNYLWAATLVLLSGCSLFSTPELNTPEKKIAGIEIAFTETLALYKRYQDEGLLSKAESIKLDVIKYKIVEALDVAYIALNAGDLTTVEGQTNLALQSLTLLSNYLHGKEKK